jgi:hypothetical protein
VALNRTKIFAPNLSAVAMIATAFGVLEARELTFSSRARTKSGQILTPHVRGILRWPCRAHVLPHDGCGDQPIDRKTAKCLKQENTMSKSRTLGAAIAFAVLSTAALATVPANAAVVYCKTAGVPQGCVVRTQPVVVAPVVRPVAPIARAAVVAPGATVRHVGYTRVTPYGVRHVGYTRVRR